MPVVITKDIRTGTTPVTLENGTRIYEYSHVVKGATIGKNCMIGQCCYIGGQAVIGENTRVQNNNNVFDGVILGKDVFIGPGVNFTNDHDPSVRLHKIDNTVIREGATICANVTIIAPCDIGPGARIGAGSIVLRDVKENERVNWLVK
jgi:UDP-2-acetamido-3-amino-2,3-dideoxy-glucuronate N-acetyltransferase